MTRDEFFGAPVVCPYCDPAKPRIQRQIPSNEFEAHRKTAHTEPGPCGTFDLAFASRDEELITAARQRAFERGVALGDHVLARWEERGCLFESLGTVTVLGAGFFRIELGTASEWIRIPEYGCSGWSLTNCVRPAWEHTEAAGQVAP